MNKVFAMWCAAAGVTIGNVMLAGCASPKPLYQWESYQPQVYQYFEGEAREVQVTEPECGLEKIRAVNGAMLPGYHTQLGMLYSGLSKNGRMVQRFNTEKALFPESATYIGLLMKNMRKGTN